MIYTRIPRLLRRFIFCTLCTFAAVSTAETVPLFGDHILSNNLSREYTGTILVAQGLGLPTNEPILVNDSTTVTSVAGITGSKVQSITSDEIDRTEEFSLRIHNNHLQLLSWSIDGVTGIVRNQDPANFLPQTIDTTVTTKTSQVGQYFVNDGSGNKEATATCSWLWLAEETLTTASGTHRCQKILFEFEWSATDDSLSGEYAFNQWWSPAIGLIREEPTTRNLNGAPQDRINFRELSDHSISRSIVVQINPESERPNTTFRIVDNGTSGYDSGEQAVGSPVNLPPGTYELTFPTTSNDWAAPAAETIEITAANDQSITRDLVGEFGSIKVTIEPEEARSQNPGWALLQGDLQRPENAIMPSGGTLDNVPVGDWELAYTGLQGWTTPARQNIAIAPGLIERTVTYVLISTEVAVGIDDQVHAHASPRLTGTISNGAADVVVTFEDRSYLADNFDDGTWALPPNTIPARAEGTYPITATAFMPDGSPTAVAGFFTIEFEPYPSAAPSLLQLANTDVITDLTDKFEDAALERYRLDTNLDSLDLRLFTGQAPITVANFKRYVDAGIYTNAFFHSATSLSDPNPISPSSAITDGADKALIGGRFNLRTAAGSSSVQVFFSGNFGAIVDEIAASNTKGTLAMYKSGDTPNSASNEWYFNLRDNSTEFDATRTVFGVIDTTAELATLDAMVQSFALSRRVVNLGRENQPEYYPLPLIGSSATIGNLLRMQSFTPLRDRFAYTVVSSDTAIATATINDQDELVTTPGGNSGLALITVTAEAPDGRTGDWGTTVINGTADTTYSGRVACGTRGLSGVVLYLDVNENGTYEHGEPEITTLADDDQTIPDESGTWSIALLPGDYQLRVKDGNGRLIQPQVRHLTAGAPVGDFAAVATLTVTNYSGAYASPVLTGLIDDPQSDVAVLVDGNTYSAQNNGDGTWTLPSDTITPPLSLGTHSVVVSAVCDTEALGSIDVIPSITPAATPAPLSLGSEEHVIALASLGFQDNLYEQYTLTTSAGELTLRLYEAQTPATVANFIAYVDAGLYTDTIIHRGARFGDPRDGASEYSGGSDFVLQGGDYHVRPANGDGEVLLSLASLGSTPNEPGASNLRGTIAMAKIDKQPNSATNEWFFNLGNNSGLDSDNGGFTVFAEIVGVGTTPPASVTPDTPEAVWQKMADLNRWNLNAFDNRLNYTFPVPLLDSYADDGDFIPHLLRMESYARLPDTFTYSVISSAPSIFSAEITDAGNLVVTPESIPGTATITVTATAPDGRTGVWAQDVTRMIDFEGYVSGSSSGVAGVRVYVDVNQNDQWDIGELGILTGYDDPDTAENEQGLWRFSLPAGDHRIGIVQPSQSTVTPTFHDLTALASTADFALGAQINLAATPFIDVNTSNGTGTFDDDETPITGLPILIQRNGYSITSLSYGKPLSLLPGTYEMILDPDVANAAGYAIVNAYTEMPSDSSKHHYVAVTQIAPTDFHLAVKKGINLISLPGSLVADRGTTALGGHAMYSAFGRRIKRTSQPRPFRGYWLIYDDVATTLTLSIYPDPRTEISLPPGRQAYGPAAPITPTPVSRAFNGRRLNVTTSTLSPGQAVIQIDRPTRTVPVR